MTLVRGVDRTPRHPRALEASGRYEVVGEAGDGVEAIAQAESLVPELVLLDLSMPRMDGLEALPRLHAVSPISTVVVLSRHTRDLAEASALADDDDLAVLFRPFARGAAGAGTRHGSRVRGGGTAGPAHGREHQRRPAP